MRSMQSVGKVRLDDGKHNIRSPARRRPAPTPVHKVLWRFALARNASPGQYQAEIGGYPGNASLGSDFVFHHAFRPVRELAEEWSP